VNARAAREERALPLVEVTSEEDLLAWLDAHHGQAESVWLVTWKKHVAAKFVSREAVLDALVAYGWVDGRRKKLDDDRTMQLIARRRQQAWASSYKERAARLEDAGRMHEAGRASVAEGKRSGLWDFYAEVDALVVPGDLADALAARPPAAERFAAFAPSARRNMLRWITIAKSDATRGRRIAEVARLAAENRKPPHM